MINSQKSIINKSIESTEIQSLINYQNINKQYNLILKTFASRYVATRDKSKNM